LYNPEVSRVDSPVGWHAAARALDVLRSAMIARLVVLAVAFMWAIFTLGWPARTGWLLVVFASAYVVAIAASVGAAAVLALRAPHGAVAASVACVCLAFELSAMTPICFGALMPTPLLLYAIALALAVGFATMAFAARGLAEGVGHRDDSRRVARLGRHVVVVTAIAFLVGPLVFVDRGLAMTIALMDVVYGLAVFLGLAGMLGAIRDAVRAFAPEPPRAIAVSLRR
jgi:hypothetical protein